MCAPAATLAADAGEVGAGAPVRVRRSRSTNRELYRCGGSAASDELLSFTRNVERESVSSDWKNCEDRVKEVATLIWDRPCTAGQAAGVDVDGVVVLRSDAVVYIEMTQRRDLNKVREDVTKLITAKLTAAGKGVFASTFCVIEGEPTTGMKDAGQAHNVNVLSFDSFQRLFFDFDAYRLARVLSPFGSAVDPLTGQRDDTAYTRVKYSLEKSGRDYSIDDLANLLAEGRRIVLVGEYGSGKSRCIKELFVRLATLSDKSLKYPVAIDLRESWGLKRAGELVRRHFSDLGLERSQDSAIRASLRNATLFLLDGFDELGSQAWSNDDRVLKSIRARSLEGVRDLVAKSSAGILIAGREHYFPGNDEMFSALGLDPRTTLLVRARTEFTEEEIEDYFDQRSINISIPSWLPRRPLICQTVSNMTDAEASEIFGVQGNEAAFWDHFLNVVCRRDARISASYDPEIILAVLVFLSRLTRSKAENVGPISLSDVQRAFEMAVGRLPVDEAAVMLQRLPGLGRIGAESAERQFIDTAILDSLRARDLLGICGLDHSSTVELAAEQWSNPLGDLGQRVFSQIMATKQNEAVRTCRHFLKSANRTLSSDIACSLMRGEGTPIDLGGMEMDGSYISTLDLSERGAENFIVKNSVIFRLKLPLGPVVGALVQQCEVGKVEGITAAAALPSWLQQNKVDEFDSTSTTAEIRRLGLSPAQEILIAIVKKTFFQKGSGRKEEALLRGLGNIAPSGLATKVLNLLLRENVLSKFKGDDGWVYAPNREFAGRMKNLTDQLRFSRDPLWDAIEQM